jgi:hypothetical protein
MVEEAGDELALGGTIAKHLRCAGNLIKVMPFQLACYFWTVQALPPPLPLPLPRPLQPVALPPLLRVQQFSSACQEEYRRSCI